MLLAGPIVRRVRSDQVTIWTATADAPGPQSRAIAFPPPRRQPVPSLPPTSTRLGARLWVSLFAIEAEWLHGESIEYDLQLDTPGTS